MITAPAASIDHVAGTSQAQFPYGETVASTGSPSQLLPLCAALIAGVTTLVSRFLYADGDTYWHIAAGNWILAHFAVPHSDPFSFTAAGRPWVAHEWLSEVVMALAFRLGYWTGVTILFAAAAAITAGLLMRDLRRWLQPFPACVLALLAMAAVAPGLLARPHILALPALECWTAGLLMARSRGRIPSFALLPVMTLWANLHGGFIVGIALIVPLAIEAIFHGGTAQFRVALGWAVFLAGSVLAALLTPNGLAGMLFPFHLLSMRHLSLIGEWQPANFGSLNVLELFILAGLYLGFSRDFRIPTIRLLLLLALVHGSLVHAREVLLLGIVGVLVLAEPLGSWLGSANKSSRPATLHAGRRWASLTVAALAALILAIRLEYPVHRVNDRMYPTAALAHLPDQVRTGHVFNAYQFGGFLIYSGIRPFIDSRADMYDPEFLDVYREAVRPIPKTLEFVLDHYDIAWTIMPPDSEVATFLDRMPEWKRIFGDDVAVIHVRRTESRDASEARVRQSPPH